MENLPLTSIVIVNYNGKQFLKDCFESIGALDYPREKLEIFMVDNGSGDGSVDYMKDNFPAVTIIINSENNYAKANNLGIKASTGEYIVLMNNDIKVDKKWLIKLIETAMSDFSIGAVGSKILFMDGTIQSLGHQEYPNFYWGDIGFNDVDCSGYNNAQEDIKSICGCSVLYRKKCLDDVGALDEDFNMYLEDVDMGIRCRNKGWKLAVCVESIIYHKYNGSVGGWKEADLRVETNRLMLVAKHWPDKLPDALFGKGCFSAVEGRFCHEAKDIGQAMVVVYYKLIKEHGLRYARELGPLIFNAVKKIYNFEKDILVKEARTSSSMLAAKEEEFRVFVVDKERQLAAKEEEFKRFATEKEEQLCLLRQQRESEINTLIRERDALQFKVAVLEKELKELSDKTLFLEKDNNEKELVKNGLQNELDKIRFSRCYRLILKPLWFLSELLKRFIAAVFSFKGKS